MIEGIGKIWALSDFHLPSSINKTMEKYDPIWKDHPNKIVENVNSVCSEHDILLVPGDISWAHNIEEFEVDAEVIAQINCKVILSDGNHDRWASKYNKAVEAMPENAVWAVRGVHRFGNVAIVCQRLWDIDQIFPWPGHMKSKGGNEDTGKKEIARLEKKLQLLPQDKGIIRILMVHFPPVAFDGSPGILTEMINKYNVDYCVYGHVHAQKPDPELKAADITIGCTRFILSSSDWLKMKPIEVCEYKFN
jgi:predicted phosphohydrolase